MSCTPTCSKAKTNYTIILLGFFYPKIIYDMSMFMHENCPQITSTKPHRIQIMGYARFGICHFRTCPELELPEMESCQIWKVSILKEKKQGIGGIQGVLAVDACGCEAARGPS
jgi:hypothetical protein